MRLVDVDDVVCAAGNALAHDAFILARKLECDVEVAVLNAVCDLVAPDVVDLMSEAPQRGDGLELGTRRSGIRIFGQVSHQEDSQPRSSSAARFRRV